MKKIKFLFATFLAFALGVLCLSACNLQMGMSGTYYFASIRMEAEGTVVEHEVGDLLPSGVIANKDIFKFRLKSNGSVEATIKLENKKETATGTWKAVEGESDKITITIDGVSETFYCDGSTLIMYLSDSLMTVTFKK